MQYHKIKIAIDDYYVGFFHGLLAAIGINRYTSRPVANNVQIFEFICNYKEFNKIKECVLDGMNFQEMN